MVKFLHTSDWQLGMTRHFLEGEAQSRYSSARTDAVRSMAAFAHSTGCEFVVVAGDVFEANLLGSQTVRRALDALSAFDVPVFLLPGNHDPLNAVSIYRSSLFTQACPAHVVPILGPGVIEVRPGVEIVAAPLFNNRPLTDLVADAIADLGPADGTVRIVLGHGQLETVAPLVDNPGGLRLEPIERAIAAGTIHYVALGDRHGRLSVGATGRIHYSGSPEVTEFRDVDAGDVLVAEVDADSCVVTPHHVGTWAFVDIERHVDTAADLDDLERELLALPAKERTVVRTALTGTLGLADKARLDDMVSSHVDLFAALFPWEKFTDLAVVVDPSDLVDLGVGGFVASAVSELSVAAAAGDAAAADALSLLFRLAKGGGR